MKDIKQIVESILDADDLDSTVSNEVAYKQFLKYAKKFEDKSDWYDHRSSLGQELNVNDAVVFFDGTTIMFGIIGSFDDDGKCSIQNGHGRNYASVYPSETIKLNSYEDGIKIIKLLMK